MKKLYTIGMFFTSVFIQAQISSSRNTINVNANVKQDVTVKDEAAIQKQNYIESQAAGAAIAVMVLRKARNKFEESTLMYEIDPNVETAFEVAKYAKQLFNAGELDNRFGPILKEHKILVVKYKGKYKKYRKANK